MAYAIELETTRVLVHRMLLDNYGYRANPNPQDLDVVEQWVRKGRRAGWYSSMIVARIVKELSLSVQAEG